MAVANIDEYIKEARPFAKPVLNKLRSLVHQACPQVEESVKWGMPAFGYQGPLCHMAGFKEHCVFGFWKESLLKDPKGYIQKRANHGGDAMGHFGKIKSLDDLPPDRILLDLIRQAVRLNEQGIKVPKAPADKSKNIAIPDELLKALSKNKKAEDVFNKFPPSAQRDYAEWISEAKTEPTRLKRLETTIAWLLEGKRKNWKYEKK